MCFVELGRLFVSWGFIVKTEKNSPVALVPMAMHQVSRTNFDIIVYIFTVCLGLSLPECTGWCQAGYYCESGSTSPIQHP